MKTSDNSPRVSVIITYFNEVDLLPRAIESVKAQTYTGPIEIIVVDDFSTVPPVLDPDRDRDVIVVRPPKNLGLPGARNFGAGVATGAFLAYLDADDVYMPERIADHIRLFEAEPSVGLVGGKLYVHRETVNLETPRLILEMWPELAEKACVLPSNFRQMICRYYCFMSSATTVRREVFSQIDGYRAHYRWGEEWDFLVRAAQVTQIGYVPAPAQRYLCREGSICSTINPLKHTSAARMFLDWREKVNDLPPDLSRELRKRASEWYLLAAQSYYEDKADAGAAFKNALCSIATQPSTWGARSLIRYTLVAIPSMWRK